jgi:hypothetical protein
VAWASRNPTPAIRAIATNESTTRRIISSMDGDW